MPRTRSPNRDMAFEIFKENNGAIENREIAKILNENEKTISNWKCRDKWQNKLNCSTTKDDCSTTKRKKGAQPGNKTSTQFKPGTQAAYRTGLFSRYMPKETLEIITAIEDSSPLDILWDQIMIAYTAICRAQQIMYVKDINDMTKTQVGEKNGDNVYEEKWEVQQAWDKQANFLKSQARAQSELRSMIKQYNELLNEHPELATEEQRARINKIKIETDKIKKELGENNKEPIKIEFIKASQRGEDDE